MKYLQLFIATLIICFVFSNSKNLREKVQVVDNGSSGINLSTVVRRTPKIVTNEHQTHSPHSSSMSFSNSNTNTGGGSAWGKSATIVGPKIVLKGTSTVSAIKETPAHVGWNRSTKTVTSLNKQTGRVEQHKIDSKTPIMGQIQEVKNLKATTTRVIDVDSNTMSKPHTTFSEH